MHTIILNKTTGIWVDTYRVPYVSPKCKLVLMNH